MTLPHLGFPKVTTIVKGVRVHGDRELTPAEVETIGKVADAARARAALALWNDATGDNVVPLKPLRNPFCAP